MAGNMLSVLLFGFFISTFNGPSQFTLANCTGHDFPYTLKSLSMLIGRFYQCMLKLSSLGFFLVV